jgi:hypothetical protein
MPSLKAWGLTIYVGQLLKGGELASEVNPLWAEVDGDTRGVFRENVLKLWAHALKAHLSAIAIKASAPAIKELLLAGVTVVDREGHLVIRAGYGGLSLHAKYMISALYARLLDRRFTSAQGAQRDECGEREGDAG